MDSNNLNRLRAAVLGANDGTVSVAVALLALIGVVDQLTLLYTAIAVSLAGAVSMSAGEYTSVATQRDYEIKHGAASLTSPIVAAVSSFFAFFAGAAIPAIVAVVSENITLTVLAVVATLGLTSVAAGGGRKAILRMVVVGSLSLIAGILANAALTAFSN